MGSKSSDMCSYKRPREHTETQRVHTIWPRDGRDRNCSDAVKARRLLATIRTRKRPRWIFSLEFSGGVWPVDTLILIPSLQNCKKINFYDFKLYTVCGIFFYGNPKILMHKQ